MRRFAFGVLVVGLVAGFADARPRFTCRDGTAESAKVRGMKTGGRTYPFCITDSERDGECRFSFCPDLGFVLGCILVPQCAGHLIQCTDPGWDNPSSGDRYAVAQGKSRIIARRVDGDRTVTIKLRCR